MKTRLYIAIVGLLMAACITSYGQEIVSEFEIATRCYGSSIVETSQGELLVGTYRGGGETYMIYKLSSEGMLIDSISILGSEHFEGQLTESPISQDNFVATFRMTYMGNIYLHFILIDENLAVLNESSASIHPNGNFAIPVTPFLVTPSGDILFHYSELNGERHVVRYTLLGTFVDDIVIPKVLSYGTLSVFTLQPLTYSGGTIFNENSQCINYIYDNDLQLVDSLEYSPVSPDITFTNGMGRFIPFSQPGAASHLMVTNLNESGASGPALVKYDIEGNPIAHHRFTDVEQASPKGPVIHGQNNIYTTFGWMKYGVSQYLISMDGNLDITWVFPLPCPDSREILIRAIKMLQNGDIAIATSYETSYGEKGLQVFIIRDNDPTATSEMATHEKPFKVYPNPIKDVLKISFTDNTTPARIELYDMTGRRIATTRNKLESIDISTMPTGVYMLLVTTKDGMVYYEKILKD